MLISQRIAKDPNFLKAHGTKKLSAPILFQTRMDVIDAVTFLVDNQGIDGGDDSPTTVGEVKEKIFGDSSVGTQEKREKMYHTFARPPFPLVILESSSFCLLIKLESDTPLAWTCRYITKTGWVSPYTGRVIMEPDRDKPRNQWQPLTKEIGEGLTKGTQSENQEEAKRAMNFLQDAVAAMRAMQWLACETLTFVNCQNVVRHGYTPKKAENASLPKVLLPKFTYHVLDIYRERKGYASLEEISEHLWQPHEGKKTRAHLVRGHFKKTRTGLFWWNAFVRNRKNVDTLGGTIKDYHVHTD